MIRRYPNSRFSKLSPDKYKYYPQVEVYARSTCLHNNILNVDETAEGSGRGTSRIFPGLCGLFFGFASPHNGCPGKR